MTDQITPPAEPDKVQAIVGFWIEMVPKLRRPNEAQIRDWMESINGQTHPQLSADGRALLIYVKMHMGLGDHRQPKPHDIRGALQMWPTRAAAKRVAVTLENEYWTARVKIARKANAPAEARAARRLGPDVGKPKEEHDN